MKDKELEDIAWRLIAEAKAEGDPKRRHRLMQEAFELVRCASPARDGCPERCQCHTPRLGRQRRSKTEWNGLSRVPHWRDPR